MYAHAQTPTLKYYTQYSEDDIMSCVRDMNKIYHNAYASMFASQQRRNSRRFRGLTRKYSSEKYMEVALLSPVDISSPVPRVWCKGDASAMSGRSSSGRRFDISQARRIHGP